MATKKSTTTKKTTAKKTAKRVPRRKPVKRAAKIQTLRVAPPTRPFFTFAITVQTLYWLIIAAAVLALGLWTIHLQTNVNDTYDTIDNTSNSLTMPLDSHHKKN